MPASNVPNLVIGWWAAPTILEHGSPEQIERFIPPARSPVSVLVPAVQRARCGLGPGVVADEGRRGRRRLEADRAEGVDVARALGAVGRLPGAHRPRCAEAQGHHVLPRRHDVAGHRHPPAARDHRRRSVQRGVLRRRVRARRDGGRSRSTTGGGWHAQRWPTSASRWPTAPRSATRWKRCCAPWPSSNSTRPCRTASAG